MPYKEIDLTSIRTYEACRRASKVGRAVLGKAPWPGMSFHDFLEVLPNVLRANEIKSLAKFIIRARELGKPIIAMINGETVTLKKFYIEHDGIRLQPANPDMAPIYLRNQDVQILGIVTGVIRPANTP